jgi:hypothetical protein
MEETCLRCGARHGPRDRCVTEDRVQLRRILSTRLGMPDRIEVWCGGEAIGLIVGGTKSLILSPLDPGCRLTVIEEGARLVVRFEARKA